MAENAVGVKSVSVIKKTRFNFDCDLPLIYSLLKLHKGPTKFRFIAGVHNGSMKLLGEEVRLFPSKNIWLICYCYTCPESYYKSVSVISFSITH